MSTLSTKNNKIINWMLVIVFTIGVSLTSFVSVFAQDKPAEPTDTVEAADSVVLNETFKSLFSEAKKVSKKDDGNLFSILMISAVVIVVIIAVWLSFRPDEEDKARERKKKAAAEAAAAANTNAS